MKNLLWLGVLVVAACGGGSSGSGISSSKKLADLSTEESRKLCEYDIKVEKGPRTVTCDDGSTHDVEDASVCASVEGAPVGASCTATVGDAEDCFEALGDDPCNVDFKACGAILNCAFNSDFAFQDRLQIVH